MTKRYENFNDPGNRKYISRIMNCPLLEKEQELEYARKWREEKNEKALHALTESYARYVVKLASKYVGYELPLADLIQEGNIGLMEAAERFDPSREYRFSTYAMWWINASIRDYVLRNTSIVRVATTASQKALFFNFRRLQTELTAKPNRVLTDKDRKLIAEKLNVSFEDVVRMEAYLSHPDQSLNNLISDEEKSELIELLVSPEMTPEEETSLHQSDDLMHHWVEDAMEVLNDREKSVIEKRFLDENKMTLSEIGVGFGLTKERIRQIEKGALEKLKKILHPKQDEFKYVF